MAEMAELKAALESILFVADRPVDLTELRRVLDVPREAVEDLLALLSQDYAERGIRIARFRDTVRMVTASDTASYIQAFLGLEQTVRLSPAALETLAIIAFRQPATRAQVEAIRGVNSDGVIDTLEGRGLIEVVGRLESPGHPVQYGTTMAFLHHFGLESLDELRPHDLVPAETVAVQTEMLSEQQRLASRLRGITARFAAAIDGVSDERLRRRPAENEWSAVEVLGHIADKMTRYDERVQTVLKDSKPFLTAYDQDAEIRRRDYQHANPVALLESIQQACEHFARTVEAMEDAWLERVGIHEEEGAMTARALVEMPLNAVEEHLEQLNTAVSSTEQ